MRNKSLTNWTKYIIYWIRFVMQKKILQKRRLASLLLLLSLSACLAVDLSDMHIVHVFIRLDEHAIFCSKRHGAEGITEKKNNTLDANTCSGTSTAAKKCEAKQRQQEEKKNDRHDSDGVVVIDIRSEERALARKANDDDFHLVKWEQVLSSLQWNSTQRIIVPKLKFDSIGRLKSFVLRFALVQWSRNIEWGNALVRFCQK